jgi:hypothetical protein
VAAGGGSAAAAPRRRARHPAPAATSPANTRAPISKSESTPLLPTILCAGSRTWTAAVSNELHGVFNTEGINVLKASSTRRHSHHGSTHRFERRFVALCQRAAACS